MRFTERYLKTLASVNGACTRFGIVRLPNVLENESEIFISSRMKLAAGIKVSQPTHPIRFTSATNAAKMVLNSMPFHQSGETFVGLNTIELELGSLMERFCLFQGQGDDIAESFGTDQDGDVRSLEWNRLGLSQSVEPCSDSLAILHDSQRFEKMFTKEFLSMRDLVKDYVDEATRERVFSALERHCLRS